MATVKTEAGYFAIHIRETLAPEIFAVVAAATAAATMAQTQAEPVAQGLTDAAVLDWLELADSVTIGRNRADETTEVVAIFGDQPIISEHESLRAAVRAALSTGEHK
jgi:predicted phage gp36 major capsid-like protein